MRSPGDLSEELARELAELHARLREREIDEPAVLGILETLLSLLAEPGARNPKTRIHVGHTVLLRICADPAVEHNLGQMTPELAELIQDIGVFLDDVSAAPEVAVNFSSTPELLLQRVRTLRGRV
jgi:hypothetical protein